MTEERGSRLKSQTEALLRLRQDFDQAFASARQFPEKRRRYLRVVLGSGSTAEPFAIPLDQVAGLHKNLKRARLPGSHTPLLGIIGIKRQVIALVSAAACLGRECDASEPWTVQGRGHEDLAFAFSSVGGVFESAGEAGAVAYDGQLGRAILDLDLLRRRIFSGEEA